MIDPITALERQLKQLFTNELGGLYLWQNVVIGPRERALRIPGQPRPDGKWKEVLVARFGPYTVEAWTPYEVPPLGLIKCETADSVMIEGPLTSDTWRRLSTKIKRDQKPNEDARHDDATGTR